MRPREAATVIFSAANADVDTAPVPVSDLFEMGRCLHAQATPFKGSEWLRGCGLVREWDRQSQRVMVMADGFAWNGQTYDSLSKVAFAITSTRWNGPRFFGLRDRDGRPTKGTPS